MAYFSQMRDLSAIITDLRATVSDLVSLDASSSPAESEEEPSRQTCDAAHLVAALDTRAALFGQESDLFGDPAWTILLALHAARKSNKRLSVSDVASSSRAPITTGLRHLAILEQRGLVRRECDANDGRRAFVFLTDETADRISEWLTRL